MTVPSRAALVAGIVVVAAFGAGYVFRSEEAKAPAAPTPAEDGKPAAAPEKPAESADAGTVQAKDFPLLAKAELLVNENQGKAPGGAGYERIADWVVADPGNPTRVYFATTAYDADAGTNFVGVYGFDTKSLNWWRLYKNTYKQKDGVPPVLLRAFRHDGARLFVVEDRVNAIHPPGTKMSDIGTVLAFAFAHPELGFVKAELP